MNLLEAAALMRRAAARIDELVATYFPNPGVVQDVSDLSAELKAAAMEMERAPATLARTKVPRASST